MEIWFGFWVLKIPWRREYSEDPTLLIALRAGRNASVRVLGFGQRRVGLGLDKIEQRAVLVCKSPSLDYAALFVSITDCMPLLYRYHPLHAVVIQISPTACRFCIEITHHMSLTGRKVLACHFISEIISCEAFSCINKQNGRKKSQLSNSKKAHKHKTSGSLVIRTLVSQCATTRHLTRGNIDYRILLINYSSEERCSLNCK